MIDYRKFKEIFEAIDSYNEPEIELYFKDKNNHYMIIKYSDYITFQRCGVKEKLSKEIKFKSLDELYNAKTIDDICLKSEWENIEDIIFDGLFSIIDDQETIINFYRVKYL